MLRPVIAVSNSTRDDLVYLDSFAVLKGLLILG